MDTLQSSLGAETSALLMAAQAGETELRRLEREWAARVIDRLEIQLDPIGLEHIDPDRQYVVVALHEGFADVLVLLSLGLDLRFATRSELWRWPLLGEYLAVADHIVTDPERPIASLRSMLRNAENVFASGDSLAVFAQGTILGIETALRPGAFEVAARTGRPVLPVVIAGSHRIWEHPFSETVRLACPIYAEVLEPEVVDDASAALLSVQQRMKTRALKQLTAPPRHFDPERDGLWPDYAYEIDPAFPRVAEHVAALRTVNEASA